MNADEMVHNCWVVMRSFAKNLFLQVATVGALC